MTGVTLWALAPAEGMNVVLKVLAVIGGAALGGVLIGALGNVLVRLTSTRKMPAWGTRTLRVVGGVASGWLVWILVFGLACLFSPPMGIVTTILLLIAGVLVAPVVMIVLCAAIPRLLRRE